MEDKKHIDRIFQEKLKDFEVFPDASTWENIEQQLMKKKKRRILPLWLRLGGAAAILLLMINSGVWFFNNQKPIPELPNTDSIITDVDTESEKDKIDINNKKNELTPEKENQITQEDSSEGLIKSESVKQERVPNKNNIIQVATNSSKNKNETNKTVDSKINKAESLIENQTNNIAEVDTKNEVNNSTSIDTNDKTIKTTELPKINTDQTQTKETIASNLVEKEDSDNVKKDINDIVKEKENTLALEEEKLNSKKWSVGSTVAPVYFNTLSKGSPIDASLVNNTKSSDASLSYGIKVNYKINNKLTLQSGFNSVDLAYETENVTTLISSNKEFTNSSNLDTNVQGFNVVATSNNNNSVTDLSAELAAPQRGFFNLSGNLNQSLSYLEIPMEAKYNLLEKKFGVNVVGGVSTYILYKNGVTLEGQNGSTTLGEASNVNNVNFSGNLGLDFDYKINKKLFINVSPMFKYQFNTFSKNDGGFQPYYLGVYTGLNFRF